MCFYFIYKKRKILTTEDLVGTYKSVQRIRRSGKLPKPKWLLPWNFEAWLVKLVVCRYTGAAIRSVKSCSYKSPSLGLQQRLQYKCFPVNIAKFFKRANLKNIWEERLLLVSTEPQCHETDWRAINLLYWTRFTTISKNKKAIYFPPHTAMHQHWR